MDTADEKDLLKFITCGSVDDGKSTLIGHILYDAKLLFADQKKALEMESRLGSADGKLDYSLLLDGLVAEREQGITIDVAYRYFSTRKRSFIVADTPGHEEYTRNMAVGASYSDLALILIDSTKGVLTQTRRHTRICEMMGIRDFAFVINKMDLCAYSKDVYDQISAQIDHLLPENEKYTVTKIPVSATEGDNLIHDHGHLTWYDGQPLLEFLENVQVHNDEGQGGFCMPVQRVSRPNYKFRGFQGEVVTGKVSLGDLITVLPSGERAHVKRILVAGRDEDDAVKGDPVTICLDREIDISRGCVLTADRHLMVGSKFAARLLWMDEVPLVSGKPYLAKIGTRQFSAMINRIGTSIDMNTGQSVPVDYVTKNGLVHCHVTADEPVVFDRFDQTKELGELLLIDRVSNMTAAIGVVEYGLDREGTPEQQDYSLTRSMREKKYGFKAKTIWFTGLSGSGKSTLANGVEQHLFEAGFHTMVLDGDNIRMGLNRDLGFSPGDRKENIRRTAETAKLLNDAGVVVLASFVSPYARDRQMAREIIGDAFVEVYVSTDMSVCEERDVKGLYARARRGEIREFTGVNSPYEVPKHPEITIDTGTQSKEESIRKLMEEVLKYV